MSALRGLLLALIGDVIVVLATSDASDESDLLDVRAAVMTSELERCDVRSHDVFTRFEIEAESREDGMLSRSQNINSKALVQLCLDILY